MIAEKKAELKAYLETNRQKLLSTIAQIKDWEAPVQGEGDQWTALQMIRHLQDAHTGLTGQITRMLAGEQTVPADFDIDRWNARIQRKTTEAMLTPEQALDTLKASHANLLEIIDHLVEEDFEKSGYQPFLKKVLPLEEFIKVVGYHEAGHADELTNAIK